MSGLMDIGAVAVRAALELGADEATARVSQSSSTELSRRDGRVEMAQESRSRGATMTMLVDGRYSSHSTSDLRPEALRTFLTRAIEATRFLEPDPDRGLLPLDEMGVAEDGPLEQHDPSFAELDADHRRDWAQSVEEAGLAASRSAKVRSLTAYVWDGSSEQVMVCSNGFSVGTRSTSFGHGMGFSLEDKDGRLPESGSYISVRQRSDLPDPAAVAADALERTERRLGSGPAPSGRYPMLLENRSVGRILGVLLTPLAGRAIFERRSCMADKLGEVIAATSLNLIDDPLLPRGLSSRPCDGDGQVARRRNILEAGRLEMFFLDVYNARRLKKPPTTGGASNLIVPPGTRSPQAVAAALPRAISVEGFLGGNANTTTGDFSFGITGRLLEHGEKTASLGEMNVAGNIFDVLARFVEACDDPWPHSAWRCPTLVFDDIQFSGS